MPEFRQEILHFHVCGGAGGGKKGFNRGEARVGSAIAVPRFICGVDVDLACIADFNRIAGAPATPLDLLTREQFVAFHGAAPPPGWREATPDDFRRAAHGERPHIVFMSTPCKGFSGLLSDKVSRSAKYQALNGLTLRAVWLTLEAWADDPPEFILFENVPRIATRGRWLLDQIKALLDAYGYLSAETVHDCGEIGHLAQSRKRFLLVARHAAKVPPFLYEPERRRLRGVGEVLDRLPLPGDLSVGPMHRVPNLQWKTWVRLAFIEAGSDWRSLNRLRVEGGMLADFAIAPDTDWHRGVLGVTAWDRPAGTVTGRSAPTTGTFSVADPRPSFGHRDADLGVGRRSEPVAALTDKTFQTSGIFPVADPKPGYEYKYSQLGVGQWVEPASTIINVKSPGQGRYAIADPRPGFGGSTHHNVYRIVGWGEHARTITSGHHPAGGAGCVADPRAGAGFGGKVKYRVTAYGEPSGTVIDLSTTGQGACAVGDPRMTWADTAHRNKLEVVPYGQPAGTVTGADRVSSGALCVGDPRPEFARDGRASFQTGGHYGVLSYDAPSGAITASGQHDNGRWSVADPRPAAAGDDGEALPRSDDRLVAVIRALDGTWHRPFTTYELAALQGYVDPDEGALEMEGTSDSAWRERIGNMVPPPSGAAIMSVIARTLLLAWSGQTFMLSSEPIWVRDVALAATLDLPPCPE